MQFPLGPISNKIETESNNVLCAYRPTKTGAPRGWGVPMRGWRPIMQLAATGTAKKGGGGVNDERLLGFKNGAIGHEQECDGKTEAIALLVVDLDLAGVDALNDSMRVLAVNSAANRLSRAEDLLYGAGEVLGKRLEAHLAGNLDDLVQRDVAAVLDVLLLLAVARGLLERLDDERRGRGHHRDSRLTVLHGKLDSDTQTLPVTRGLGNVFTHLLGRETKRTDLGCKRRGGTHLATGGSEVDDLKRRARAM